MSLINDALKRAKQAQRENPGSSQPELPLIPAKTTTAKTNSPAWLWPVYFTLLLSACAWLIWQALPQNSPEEAKTSSHNDVLVVHAAGPAKPTAKSDDPKTNSMESAAQTAAQPAPLKLQSIFLIPSHPSVMISGKSLFIGDHIGEYRVANINASSVTLVSPTETKVLRLP